MYLISKLYFNMSSCRRLSVFVWTFDRCFKGLLSVYRKNFFPRKKKNFTCLKTNYRNLSGGYCINRALNQRQEFRRFTDWLKKIKLKHTLSLRDTNRLKKTLKTGSIKLRQGNISPEFTITTTTNNLTFLRNR